MHLVASVHSGHTSAIQVLARFGAAIRGDPLYEALARLGRCCASYPGKIGVSLPALLARKSRVTEEAAQLVETMGRACLLSPP